MHQPAPTPQRCSGVTRAGHRCHNPVVQAGIYCPVHAQMEREKAGAFDTAHSVTAGRADWWPVWLAIVGLLVVGLLIGALAGLL